MTVHRKMNNKKKILTFAASSQFELALKLLNLESCKKKKKKAKNQGIKKKKMFPDLACHAALCTVLNNKQLLSVLTGCV